MANPRPHLAYGQAEQMIAAVLKAGTGGKIETRTFPDGRRAVVMVAVMPDGETASLLVRAVEAVHAVVRQEVEGNV